MKKMNPAKPCSTRKIAFFLGMFIFCVFSLTASYHAFGYESLNIDEVENFLRAKPSPPGRSGFIEVAVYAFPALLKFWLVEWGTPFRLDWLAYVFIQPLISTLICLAFFGFLVDLYGRRSSAIVLTLALAFCTMIWPYSKFGMENNLTLWVLLGCWSLYRYSRSSSSIYLFDFGLCIAMVLLTKVIGILFSISFFVCFIWLAASRKYYQRKNFGSHFASLLLLCAAGAAAFFVTNRIRYGGWVFAGRYDYGIEVGLMPVVSSLAAILFSPGKSIFLYSPLLLISFYYFGRFWRRFPELRMLLFGAFVISVWQILGLRFFYEETWGPRRLLYLLPLMCLPLGIWAESFRNLSSLKKTASAFAIVAGILVQFLAVGFDYGAHAFVLAKQPFYTVSNTMWLPELSPLTFNYHLYRSLFSRLRGGESIDFVYAPTYLPWTGPKNRPQERYFDVSEHDEIDLWYVKQREHWPETRQYTCTGFYVPIILVLLWIWSAVKLILLYHKGLKDESSAAVL